MFDLGRMDVLVDLCLQREYLAADGIRRCRNAFQVLPNVRRLMALARWAKMPVISCVDSRRPNQVAEDFLHLDWRSSPVRRKAAYTLLHDHAVVESDNCLCVSLDVLKTHQQTIFTKYHRDPFTNPKLDRLLTEMPCGRFVVFGAPLETSLRILVLGLIRRSRPVVVIHDACGYWDADEGLLVLRQLHVKGCAMVSCEDYVAGEFARLRRPAARRTRRRRSVA